MFVLLYQGEFRGQAMNIADTNGAAGVTDGWAKDLQGVPYPFESSGVKPPYVALPASYTTWANAGFPPGPPLGALPPPPPDPE